jgi:hypothetical protein
MAWTPEQRAEVLEWARTAKGDVGKERVKPPPAPAVLGDAVAAKAARDHASDVDELRGEVERAREDAEYATEELQRLTAKLAKLQASVKEQG